MKITPFDINQLLAYVFKNDKSYAGFYSRFCSYFDVNEDTFSNIMHEYFLMVQTVIPGSSHESLFTSEAVFRLLQVAVYERSIASSEIKGLSENHLSSGGTLVGRHLLFNN